jgi:cell division protease FtsH
VNKLKHLIKRTVSVFHKWRKSPVARAVPLLVLVAVAWVWLRSGVDERRVQDAGRSQLAAAVEDHPALWFAHEKTITDLLADIGAGNVKSLGVGASYAFVQAQGFYYVRVGLNMQDIDRLLQQARTRPRVFVVTDPAPAASIEDKILSITKAVRPVDLIFLTFILVMARKSMGKRFTPVTAKPEVRFRDVVGVDDAKGALAEIVGYLRNPEQFAAVGAKPPKGVILTGPPGTGKTLLARAIAGEADASFISVSGTDFAERWVGVSSENVRRLFDTARRCAPCVVFIDELDSIGSRVSGGAAADMENNRTINELLIGLDGFVGNSGVIVVGATNYLDRVDPALVRDGRFDRVCALGLPTRAERSNLFDLYLKKVVTGPDADVTALAKLSSGLAPAAIANVVNKAAMRVAHTGGDSVCQEDLLWALEEQQLGGVAVGMQSSMTSEEMYRVGYHESGHAIATVILKVGDLRKVSILPRAHSLGVTFADKGDRRLQTSEDLESELVVLLAGRAAEELLLGSVSTGSANDLERASRIAYEMVTRFGFSRLGLLSYAGLPESALKSVQSQTFDAVGDLLDQAMQKATSVLVENRAALIELGSALVDRETVDGDAVREMVAAASKALENQE